VPTRPSRIFAALAAVLLLAVLQVGCGGKKKDAAAPAGPTVPALRFAGVDLEYALERLASEAGLVVALDEIMPQDQSPDLSLIRVDLDLPAGPLNDALRVLREKVGGFDYQIFPEVLYVRSNLLVDQKTSLDLPLLDGGEFEGDLGGLAKMIMQQHPSSYINVQYVQGQSAGGSVKLKIPDKSSVKDVLIQYAAAAKYGWAMRRAGHLTHDADGKPAIFGTGIEPRGPRTGTSRLPAVYNRLSGAAALANASKRLDTPFVVYDRSVLQDARGIMNLALQNDPLLPRDETLNNLSQSGFGPGSWHFHWKDIDGVPVLMTNHFLYYLRGRDILGKKLLPGEFNGSLPELARWINSHVKDPNGEVLMGGEIVDGQAKGVVKADANTTVAQAIEQFAKSSRTSPYVIVLDLQNPFTGNFIEQPRAWRGAYLQDLAEWRSQPGDLRFDGVVRDDRGASAK
jgi:hypothetical protein